MGKKTKIIIALGIFVGVIGTLIYTSIGSAATLYLTVDELQDKKEEAVGERIKVSGNIVGESIEFDPSTILLSFELEGKNGNRVSIQYDGVKPDTLNDGWEAIVEGELNSEGVFIASELLVKCPSKYEALEEDGEEIPEDHPATDEQGGDDTNG
ncbi:cytochrome c maturation protein CcmE [Cytobacillus sp. S13-E01]|uniref:cytochrome c maturation protein CcmE n=1 Tax=Cytobacillus sp. S13-E01 TaxID=3031326 RepID=UPI0023D8C449|nr:cytochrome c maturation protein CcmE [Cytobacillus sp. S13-E01]MDF0727706.1 cytochrome c maturation protein CcmE [Cytobacillus sp. S13-E01]